MTRGSTKAPFFNSFQSLPSLSYFSLLSLTDCDGITMRALPGTTPTSMPAILYQRENAATTQNCHNSKDAT